MGDLDFLNIKDEKGLDWLGCRKLAWANTYSWSGAVDKAGWPYMVLGWSSDPDSDWGKYETRAILRAKSHDLLARAEIILRKKLDYDSPEDGFLAHVLAEDAA